MAGRVIYLVRHGHCEGAGTLLGQSDVPLTALGLQQAEALARELSAAGVERVVSSDLRRAVQTAEPIAERSRAPLSLDPRLREISYGSVDGSPWREGLEPAEPLEAFQRRVREAWQSILAGPARVAVVVAHLGVNAVILDDLGWRQHYGTAHRLELP
jgi:broad specificity phosphatase PhoE